MLAIDFASERPISMVFCKCVAYLECTRSPVHSSSRKAPPPEEYGGQSEALRPHGAFQVRFASVQSSSVTMLYSMLDSGRSNCSCALAIRARGLAAAMVAAMAVMSLM